MKRLATIIMTTVFLLAVASFSVVAEAWWHLTPPIITAPAPNEQYPVGGAVTYSWLLPWGTPSELISHYELQFANSYPNTINLFEPELGGGICDWDAVREVYATSYTASHQGPHEPVYFRVRAVFIGGQTTNWGVSYHRVGDFVSQPSPPTIVAPAKAKLDCDPSVYHEWTEVPGAVSYEYGWAQAFCNTAYLLDMCNVHVRAPTTSTSLSAKHDCLHLPIYFLVRGVFEDGSKTNWAITYYYLTKNCILCGVCPTIATEESTWGKVKQLHK